uniref:t-SNARE coiled-coil homology domain-containing protein n=1 Tax=Strigamia maritima TaxID=126957 RepID=T1IR56_STRMM
MSDFKRLKSRKGKSLYDDDDDDDVDDFTFLNHPKHGNAGYLLGGNYDFPPPQHSSSRQQQISDEIRRMEERTIQSSERSLGILSETENIGIATAEELIHQREQLQNAESKVDDTNRTLRTTQKHINSIKSVFGGIKNYFSKTPDQPKLGPSNSVVPPASSSKLESVMENSKNECSAKKYTHPALRTRGLEFPDDFETIDDRLKFLHASSARVNSQSPSQLRYQDFQLKLDKNLSEMSFGIGRLKGLASELGNEIEDQDALLVRLSEKVENANMGVEKQNKQMRQILK